MALYLETPEDFGRAIAHVREKRGWTQAQLAQLSGVTRPMVSAMEQGGAPPSFRKALLLVSVLGMSLAIAPAPAAPKEEA